MQEVTIRQRSAFKHFVSVDSPGKELCWNFFTSKKNVSFGLFKKVSPSSTETGTYVLQSGARGDVGKSITVLGGDNERTSTPASPKPTRARGLSNAIPPSSSPAGETPDTTLLSPTSFKDVFQGKSLADFNDLAGTVRRRRKESVIEGDLVELVPVTHYESSKFTVKGSYYVEEPGTYVLLWDNSFSVNTSKKLFFFVALKNVEPSQAPVKKEIENWLLKKGNKKMQGYQRRWATIDSSGVLSYFKHAGSFCRGSIDLAKARVHLDEERALIDIDSGDGFYNFKAPSPGEYQAWVAVIARFTSADALGSRVSRGSRQLIPEADTSFGSVRGPTDPDLAEVQKQAESMSISLTNELGRLKDVIETSRSRVDQKHQARDMNLILNSITDVIANALSHANGMQRQLAAYGETVRAQREVAHDSSQLTDAALHACLADNNRVRRRFGLEPVTLASFLSHAHTGSVSRLNINKAASMSSSMREDEFFDAEEGENENESDDDDSDTDSMHEAEATMTSDEEDIEEESTSRKASSAFGADTNSIAQSTKSATIPAVSAQNGSKPVSAKPIVRRTRLRAPTVSMQNISIMSLIRNNAGKDLSTVAMPIALNEPINLLQKLCEELEYSELLEQAAATLDPVIRLSIMAAFAVSAYASTVHRAGRKPFNPLLGETYECLRDDRGFKFVSEKVSHHPPIMACHAESPNYQFFQDSQVKSKFWGKSMELIPLGTVHVAFPALNEHYTWNKVTTCMRNIFSANRYLEHYGTLKITSQSTGHYCELTFKESGYFSSTKNEITGGIFSSNGQKAMSLSGNWDKSLQRFQDSSPNALEVIWRAKPNPPHHAEIYGFTQFAVELNELTPDLDGCLPNTDTRFRPDQRMYEEGRADEAEAEKQRLEQKQRDYRKTLETRGESWSPRWFRPDTTAGPDAWAYKGGYWEQRGNFENTIDLFS